ncbi:SHOCT domain-containing protein [Clostridium botulinum]|uniref:SHOCT domain-containing protein n=1 Tax=Clostridium botulinum TaxID=1491 RepID=UPI001C9BB6E6|nr:SHOCT domain-containing protein [Clostridium botulinum]MBY6860787.1 SHOCT domain-containing protein [Clostridium botulinum]MBY7043824.1 SHOCT domain-containing protein [Clostridium botulinum]
MGLFSTKPKDKMMFKLIDGICINKGTYMDVYIKENHLTVCESRKGYSINIYYQDIINVTYGTYCEEITKNKSTVGRAIVGGVLTGGLGAVVGGMSGIGTKTKTKKLFVMYLEYMDADTNTKNLVILEDVMLVGVKKFIEQIKIKMKHAPKGNDLVENLSEDIPTQILKLAELKDKNIISNDEFELKKIDLLSRM